MAMTNTVATIPGIVVPIFVGKLTESDVSGFFDFEWGAKNGKTPSVYEIEQVDFDKVLTYAHF